MEPVMMGCRAFARGVSVEISQRRFRVDRDRLIERGTMSHSHVVNLAWSRPDEVLNRKKTSDYCFSEGAVYATLLVLSVPAGAVAIST